MNTKYIYGIIASVMLMIGVVACSDNFNANLEPFETETTLSAQIDGTDLRKLTFSAEPQDTTITIISNTRWAVAVSDGGWCSVNVVSGRGNGSVVLSVLEDMISDRDCEVVLYKLNAQGERINDGRWIIAVNQKSSDVKLSPASLEPFPAQPLKGAEFEITATNVVWTLSVNYGKEDVKFISIQPISGMTETPDGNYTGTENAKFSISLQNNGTAAVRNATLELTSNAGSYSVEITQQKSEYTFDVSPNSTRYIDPRGGEEEFFIRSLSGWNVSTNEDWITFSDSGMSEGSDSRVGIKAFFSPNTNGRSRRGVIYFKPVNEGYVPVDVEIVQNGYDLEFEVSLSNGEDPVTAAGGELTYSLDSRFDWAVSFPDWIKINDNPTASGKASDTRQTVNFSIEVNNSYSSRSDSIVFTPLATDGFAGNVTLDPSKVGVYKKKFFIEQEGGQKAAISVPWIGEIYEHNKLMLNFNFYSPYYEVVEAGLRWKKEGADEWAGSESVVISNQKSATVSFLLEGLQTLTSYVAQGYVKYSNGEIVDGKICEPFTTAGFYPGIDSNPAPNR
ncbi:MAG: hypothetical protein K2N35_00850 [Muribaculaceae bacterium]|nr:hypothetical protein [Muribaculaceae bacterium]